MNEEKKEVIQVQVTLPVLRITRKALQWGIDNTQELLDQQDEAVGRTTRKNKVIAELYEADIRAMKECLEALPNDMSEFF